MLHALVQFANDGLAFLQAHIVELADGFFEAGKNCTLEFGIVGHLVPAGEYAVEAEDDVEVGLAGEAELAAQFSEGGNVASGHFAIDADTGGFGPLELDGDFDVAALHVLLDEL